MPRQAIKPGDKVAFRRSNGAIGFGVVTQLIPSDPKVEVRWQEGGRWFKKVMDANDVSTSTFDLIGGRRLFGSRRRRR